MALPYNPATRTTSTPAPKLAKASPLTNYSEMINKQYDVSQERVKGQGQEATRSALENAQRAGAIRGTSGAGFETKIQQQAVNEASKPYQDLSAGLESERAGALVSASQAQDQMKEQQRQFDFSANLQKYVTENEMDLNKMSTFVNAATAFKESGLDSPTAWTSLFQSGVFQNLIKNAGLALPKQTVQGYTVGQRQQAAQELGSNNRGSTVGGTPGLYG